ncbi:MAG: zinc metallopeptidase, partial [Lachnospiraceae bacterium]|nr:zinc metallopeptidase [Lachnospiraceae bacterium]
DNMPAPKDYLQIFELTQKDDVQYILHKSEQPEYEMKYILILGGSKRVLRAAAMTYVAAAATAILQLLRLILIARRRN